MALGHKNWEIRDDNTCVSLMEEGEELSAYQGVRLIRTLEKEGRVWTYYPHRTPCRKPLSGKPKSYDTLSERHVINCASISPEEAEENHIRSSLWNRYLAIVRILKTENVGVDKNKLKEGPFCLVDNTAPEEFWDYLFLEGWMKFNGRYLLKQGKREIDLTSMFYKEVLRMGGQKSLCSFVEWEATI